MKNKLLPAYILTLLFFTTSKVFGQNKYDLFYLSIGSSHYSNPALGSLDAANTAAERMSQLFQKMGAKSGITLLSSKEKMLNRSRLFVALTEILERAKKSKSKNPFIIVYYAGHGFSSGRYKSHFLPPGNFSKNPKLMDQEEWFEYAIAPLEIEETIDSAKMDFMMLLDCCYDGKLIDPEYADQFIIDNFGMEKVDELMKQTYNIFDAMNIMVGPDPVLFSCPPGQRVITTLYDFEDGKEETATLCRRSYITMEKLGNISVSVTDFVVMMTDENLDHRTSPAFSGWKFDEKNLQFLKMEN